MLLVVIRIYVLLVGFFSFDVCIIGYAGVHLLCLRIAYYTVAGLLGGFVILDVLCSLVCLIGGGFGGCYTICLFILDVVIPLD